jgi:hypothetical protein
LRQVNCFRSPPLKWWVIYHKYENLFRIIDIERRYLAKDDMKYNDYQNGKVGDEYNPLVQIEAVVNLSIRSEPDNKLRKIRKILDAAWVKKVDPAYIQAHIQRLNSLLTELWP